MPNLSNANIYERLGVRTIVNASGPSTRLSGASCVPRWPPRWPRRRNGASTPPRCRRAPARSWPRDGEPSVHANHARVGDGIVVLGPTCLKAGDAAIVIERVHAELGSHARGG